MPLYHKTKPFGLSYHAFDLTAVTILTFAHQIPEQLIIKLGNFSYP